MIIKLLGLKLLGGKVKESNHEIVRKIKQRDFKIFADYLFNKEEIVEPIYDESLINKSNVIDIININKEDIQKSIDYINEEKEKSLIIDTNLNYETFTQKEIESVFSEVIEDIINFIYKITLNEKNEK